MSWVKKDDNLHYEKFQDGTVKCIEDEIPFEVPERWEWCRFSDVISLFSGQDLMPDRYNDKKEGIPYITGASNIENGNVIINRWTTTPTVHATIGDLLLTVKGSGVGKMAFCDIDDVHIARQIMALRGKGDLSRNYLYFVVSAMVKEITAQANGLIPGIRREIVLKTPFPLPPVCEQMHIAEKAMTLFFLINHIENGEVALKNALQEVKARIFDLAICGKLIPQDPDDEPASVLLERIRAEKEELIKQGKIKRDKNESIIYKGDDNSYYQTDRKTPIDTPYGIPDNWAWSNLKELCNYGECESISPDKISDSAWVLDLEDIEKNTGKVLQRITNAERKTASTKHAFSKNMILYSKLRPYLNKVALADSDGYCTSEILPLNFSTIIHPGYAQLFLMSPFFVKYANHCSYGLKMPRLGTHDGQIALFAVPPYQEQLKIVDMVEQILSRASIIEDSLD